MDRGLSSDPEGAVCLAFLRISFRSGLGFMNEIHSTNCSVSCSTHRTIVSLNLGRAGGQAL